MNGIEIERQDRISGAILGLATGDALGAPHEFRPPIALSTKVEMSGGGVWEPGEWTDDTSMAICILQAWEKHGEFGSEESLDTLVYLWANWAETAPDVGVQTRSVLRNLPETTALAARKAARELHEKTGRSAGNGSLMRTAPIAFLKLEHRETALLARKVSSLTHFDDDAGDACVLWTLAIRSAIDLAEVDFNLGLEQLPTERRSLWESRISSAQGASPASFANNGWVVAAFEAAVAAVEIGKHDLAAGLEAAVRAGYDTDTVAAIAGSLLGALHGASAIPQAWVEPLHGWPAWKGYDLEACVSRMVGKSLGTQ